MSDEKIETKNDESKEEENSLTKVDENGRNSYLNAAFNGDLKEIKKIENQVNDLSTINILDTEQNNIFILACTSGNIGVVRHFESRYNKSKDGNYNIYHTNKNEVDAYLSAAYNGHLEVLKHLEETYNWNIHVKAKEKDVVVMAIDNDKVDVVKRFIECKHYDIYKSFKIGESENTIFTYAYHEGKINTVKYLENLNDILRWQIFDASNHHNSHPLLCSAIEGHLGCLKYYIENYKDRNMYVKNTNNNNIYFLAANCGHLNILKYLDGIGFKIDGVKNKNKEDIYEFTKNSKHKDVLEYLGKKKLAKKFSLISYNSVDPCSICKEKISSGETICKCINDHGIHKECYIEYLYENTIDSDFKCCYCKDEMLQGCFIAI